MRKFTMKWKGGEKSTILCRKDVLKCELSPQIERFRAGGGLIFTDTNVLALYKKKIARYLSDVPVFAMAAGEENKSADTLLALLGAMADAGLRRNSTLIALGGGVVGDVGGLAASLYMRGIDCIQVPTTLLAQVDSSVGGKTAIDFHGVKNLIGAFHQPRLVLADPSFLKTLPPREIQCGLGEIVKHAALSAPLFDRLLENRSRLFDLDFLAEIIPENIAVKADVVRRDPSETGLRKCLNLGHTTGHAVELSKKCGVLSHGECVLIGMLYESELARRYLDADGDYLEELKSLCRAVLSCDIAEIDIQGAARLALLDKKNTKKDTVALTVSLRKGEFAFLELPFSEYERALGEIRSRI